MNTVAHNKGINPTTGEPRSITLTLFEANDLVIQGSPLIPKSSLCYGLFNMSHQNINYLQYQIPSRCDELCYR